MTGVLHRFQQYYSHIKATAHIIRVFPGFQEYKTRALKCLAREHPYEKPRGSSAARIHGPGLRVKHSTTEPRRTPGRNLKVALQILGQTFYKN